MEADSRSCFQHGYSDAVCAQHLVPAGLPSFQRGYSDAVCVQHLVSTRLPNVVMPCSAGAVHVSAFSADALTQCLVSGCGLLGLRTASPSLSCSLSLED